MQEVMRNVRNEKVEREANRMSNERTLGSNESSASHYRDTTEHDAVNNRFIEKQVPEIVFCLSCRSQVSVSLPNDIIQHYMNRRHEPCCRCLYCNGPMYRYRDSKGKVQYYHDCHRCKRFLDAS